MAKAENNEHRGHRAPKAGSGVVQGSGAGAGGGNPGEDFDQDPIGGGGVSPAQEAAEGADDRTPRQPSSRGG